MSKVNKTARRSATKGLATKEKKTKDYSSFRTYVRRIVMNFMRSHADSRVQMPDAVYVQFNKIIKNIVNDIVTNAYDVAGLQNKKTVDAHDVWSAYRRLYPGAAAKARSEFELLMAPRTRKHRAAKAAEPAEQEVPKAPRAKRAHKERKGKAAPVEPAANSEEENSE
jgi:histone H3/H4